jgi:hypothetical protein
VFRKRHTELTATLEDIRKLMDQLDRRVEKMETILLVREPSSTAAGEAYEGLRRQVVSAVSERITHLTQLAQLDHALAYGASQVDLRCLLDQWLEQAALVRTTDPAGPHGETAFELVEDGGGPLEVVDPAYVDGVTARVIKLGRARRTPPARSAEVGPASQHAVETPAATPNGDGL